jgi:hypothetical protein
MGIKFVPTANALRLLDVRSIDKVGEDGVTKTYHFAKLVDEGTYESNDFMLPKEVDPSTLTIQARYNVVLDVEGKWSRLSLTPAADPVAPVLGGFPDTPVAKSSK